jgi:hypothetical protein
MRTGRIAGMTSKIIIRSSNKGRRWKDRLLSSVMKGVSRSKGHKWKDLLHSSNQHRRWSKGGWNAGVIMAMAGAEICNNVQMIITSVEVGSEDEEMDRR